MLKLLVLEFQLKHKPFVMHLQEVLLQKMKDLKEFLKLLDS
jgi:hypothetical protein